MSSQVNVRSVAALSDLKTALTRFAAEASEPVRRLQQEAQRTLDWLDSRRRHWEQQVRAWHEEARRAHAALERCRASATYDPRTGRSYVPDCSAYEAALRQAQLRQREAEQHLAAAHQWLKAVQEQHGAFQRQAQRFQTAIGEELPKATAMLDRKSASLLAYAALGLISPLQTYIAASLRGGAASNAAAPASTSAVVALPPQYHSQAGVADALARKLAATTTTYEGRVSAETLAAWVTDRRISYTRVARRAQLAGLNASATGTLVHRVAELRTLAHQAHRIVRGTRFVEFSPDDTGQELDLITVHSRQHIIHDYKPINLAAIAELPWASDFQAWLQREHGGDYTRIGNYRSMPPDLRRQYQQFLKAAVAQHRAQLNQYCRLYAEATGLPQHRVRSSILPYFVWR